MISWPLIRPSGDRAVLIEFENRIDAEINRQVRSLALTIEEEKTAGIEEVLPAYRTLMLTYDPLILGHRTLQEKLRGWMDKAQTIHLPPGRIFTLPTVYGGEHGPDLQRVSEMTGLSFGDQGRFLRDGNKPHLIPRNKGDGRKNLRIVEGNKGAADVVKTRGLIRGDGIGLSSCHAHGSAGNNSARSIEAGNLQRLRQSSQISQTADEADEIDQEFRFGKNPDDFSNGKACHL